MLNGWRIKHAGTADRRRSVTGATIALVWIRRTGPAAIMDQIIAGAATIATSATMVIRATAATGATIAINEIIATISAKEALGDGRAVAKGYDFTKSRARSISSMAPNCGPTSVGWVQRSGTAQKDARGGGFHPPYAC